MAADLDSLVIFARIVEAGSFSEAARRLKLPVSTVSRRLAELEGRLGVRLLQRSTRSLRLTDIGTDVFEQARRGAEISDAVESIVSHRRTDVSGALRLSAPPSISDSLMAPLIGTFQAAHPDVRVQLFVTSRPIDLIADGVDLAVRIGPIDEPTLVVRRIMSYRHQLLASPAYLERHPAPQTPDDLLDHRLLAFSFRQPRKQWTFVEASGTAQRTVSFAPYLEMNDYAGLAPALLAGVGIGDLPPIVLPGLVQDVRLVEVMPRWRFAALDLSLVHLGNRYLPRPVRVFADLFAKSAPTLFGRLPV